MKQIKGTDALEAISKRYGFEQDDEEVAKFREQLEVSQLIYDARNKAGLSQKELADLTGTRQSVISRLEDADYEGHSLPMLRKIAQALNKRIELRFVPLEPDNIENGIEKGTLS